MMFSISTSCEAHASAMKLDIVDGINQDSDKQRGCFWNTIFQM